MTTIKRKLPSYYIEKMFKKIRWIYCFDGYSSGCFLGFYQNKPTCVFRFDNRFEGAGYFHFSREIAKQINCGQLNILDELGMEKTIRRRAIKYFGMDITAHIPLREETFTIFFKI